jgi:predicted acylesterase/phospholipase RssA
MRLQQSQQQPASFDYFVLQGGGLRCAWQAGFLSALKSTGTFNPSAIAAVSASTALACAVIAGRVEFALRCFRNAISGNRKNIYLSKMARGQRPFPHALIYREALLKAFDQPAVDRLHSGPDIQVLVTRTTPNLSKYAGAAAGLCLWGLNSARGRTWYQRAHRQFGFCGEFISVKSCATPGELADLVLASSCTPPITPWYSLHGRPVLDGGLVASVPLAGIPAAEGRTLVLLTGPRPNLATKRELVVAGPGQDLQVASWDYRDGQKIDRLFEIGRKDGGAFIARLAASAASSNVGSASADGHGSLVENRATGG